MLHLDGIPVGINGLGGRVGGNALSAMVKHPTLKFHVIAGNDVGLGTQTPADNFVKCKRYDSTFGEWPGDLSVGSRPDCLKICTATGDFTIQLFSERDPANIPWKSVGVKGVAECTGVFRERSTNDQPGYDSHLQAGADCVSLSAPAKDEIMTVVYGVHTSNLQGVPLLSAASCTSGSIAFPLRLLLNQKEKWGFRAGSIQTIHAYTAGEQTLQDRPGPITSGGRRMFAAGVNIIPTTTGAAKTIPKVDGIGSDMAGIPFDGFSLRVPVISGSVTLLQVVLENEPELEEVLSEFRNHAHGEMKGRFALNENPLHHSEGLPLVSSHIIKRPESSIVDAEFCSQLGTLYSFPLWYGNEWGYVIRLIEALHEQCS